MRGDINSLSRFAANLRRMPTVLAQRAAQATAPKLTAIARSTFAAGQNAYGDTWEPSDDGDKITMRKSGALFAKVVFVAIGTRVRAVLGVPYARYQIGKRAVFPRGGSPLPRAYVAELERAVAECAKQELAR